jgi:hypothetical protein
LADCPALSGYQVGGGGGGVVAPKGCLNETTVVPAIRSKYFCRRSFPGVTTPNSQSIRSIGQKILLMLRMNALPKLVLLPSVICALSPMSFFPIDEPEEDSINAKYSTSIKPKISGNMSIDAHQGAKL